MAGGLPGGVQLVIERIEMFSLVTVDIEPPVTDEVLLVEQSSIGAEEAVLGKSASTIVPADVERLALCLRVGVVAFSKEGIVECVLSWGSGL